MASGGWIQHGSLLAITELPNREWGPVVGFKPFDGDGNWMMEQDLVYKVGKSVEAIVVPAGFVTDFASIPAFLQGFLPPAGPYRDPAVIHDFLYWDQRCSKTQSDNLFFIAMSESRTDRHLATAITEVVSAAGAKAWANNAFERKTGLPRVIPADRRELPRDKWSSYRAHLFDQGSRASRVDGAAHPKYCSLGNTRRTP